MRSKAIVKTRMIIGMLSMLILLLSLGFNGLLSASTLNRLAVAALLSGYQGAGEHVALAIERGLRFGKPLGQYAGMEEILADLRDGVSGVSQAQIIDSQGAILYAVPRQEVGAFLNDELKKFDMRQLEAKNTTAETIYYTSQDTYRIVIPLQRHGGQGGLALEIEKAKVDAISKKFTHWVILLLVVVGLMVCMVLPPWIALLTAPHTSFAEQHRSLSILIIVLIGGTQLAYSSSMLFVFRSFLQQTVQDKARVVAHFIQRDFEYIIHKGVDVHALKGGEELLQRVVQTNPDLCGAALIDAAGNILAQAGRIDTQGATIEQSVDAYWPSRFRQRMEVMRVRLYTDPAFITASVRSLAWDLATTLAMSLLLLRELTKLLGLLSVRMLQSAQVDASVFLEVSSSAKALRAAGFLFFLGYDMCISFIPILAHELSAPKWGLSNRLVGGLPISAEMICAGIALLGAGLFSDRSGWRRVYIFGAISAATGLILAGLTDSLMLFIAARAISGFGFGLSLMASQIGTLEEEQAGVGIADVFAGIFAGSICGSAAGAMLAERMGFKMVFLVAAALVPLAILALIATGRSRTASQQTENILSNPGGGSWRFLRDPHMHLLLILIGAPAALCLTGFLYYLLPLRLQEAQVPQSDIGRLFMLYGLCFITVGPLLGQWLDRIANKETGAMLTGLLCGCALLIASCSPTLAITAVAVLFLGVAQCLAAPSTMLCVISLRSAKELGRAKTASLYRSLERVGQVLGPIIFGLILVRLDARTALYTIGGVTCVLSLIFRLGWRIGLRR